MQGSPESPGGIYYREEKIESRKKRRTIKKLNRSIKNPSTWFGETPGFSGGFIAFSFLSIGLVYLSGAILIRLMDVDASQYASISMELLKSNNFLELYHRGGDYLDKPPFLFWSSALFFYLFGIGEFTYRISSLLFLALGAYSTYRLGKSLFGQGPGLIAAIFMLSNQAFFLMGHDVRTDGILAGAVIFSIWQIYLFSEKKSLMNLLLASLGMAISMMEKGPIGLMIPILAFIPAWVLEKNWKAIFKWEWILGGIVIGILLIPMSIGLFQQFDLHPDKIVNGRENVSGLRFFFWEQSFGRLTGENVWKDDSTPLFFTHTFLWAFLPWMLIAISAFSNWAFRWIRSLNGRERPKNNFLFTGFILTFLAFSLSQFKLPHYINVIFPLAALFTADYVFRISNRPGRLKNWFLGAQVFVSFLLLIILLVVCLVFFPMTNIFFWLIFLFYLGFGLIFFLPRQDFLLRLIGPSLMVMIGVNFILNLHFYPELLRYQPGSEAAAFINGQQINPNSIRRIRLRDHEDYHMHSLDFYLKTSIPYIDPSRIVENLSDGNYLVFTDSEGRKLLEEKMPGSTLIKSFDHFHVTTLSIEFLMPDSRSETLDKRFLIRPIP
jgi:Dolichyl-phosphate-mannose-protein mannosyltransferase